ncbi:MAG: 50S ribosomal protein L13 [Alphaproteobacteria bacterium]
MATKANKPAPAITAAKKVAVKRTPTKTFALRHQDVKKHWVLFDAEGVILGRLASAIAMTLRGKTKAIYTPSVDCGDNVIVINAEKVKMTGKKATDKVYYYHTGFVGGIKERTRDKMLAGKFPERVIELAVQRMMPRGPLARRQLTNLRVYKGAEHPHAAQAPTVIDFASRNPKNKRG